MSKEVYSIENQEKFNVAMIIGHVVGLHNGTKYEEEVREWTYDTELANLALEIYNRVKAKGYSNEEIINVVDDYFAHNHNVNELSNAEEDEDYQDFWYGVECGDYFGLPNEESSKKSDEAMRLFMGQMQYGFVHEVIEANNLA